MGDLLRSLQTTAGRRPFIGGTPEKGELPMAYRVVTGPGSDLIAPQPGLEQAREYSRTLRSNAKLTETAACSKEGVGGGGYGRKATDPR